MHWVLAADTRHLLCYYVLSGRYSHRDGATYANWAPNSGTEEWLERCSRPAGKQEPCTPADCKQGFTGQQRDCKKLVLKISQTLLSKPAVDVTKGSNFHFQQKLDKSLKGQLKGWMTHSKKYNLDRQWVASSHADTVFSPSPKLASPVHWVLSQWLGMLLFRRNDWHHCVSMGLLSSISQTMQNFLCHLFQSGSEARFMTECLKSPQPKQSAMYSILTHRRYDSFPNSLIRFTVCWLDNLTHFALSWPMCIAVQSTKTLICLQIEQKPWSVFSVASSSLLGCSFPPVRPYCIFPGVLPLQILTVQWLHWKRKHVSRCRIDTSHLLVRQVCRATGPWQHDISV